MALMNSHDMPLQAHRSWTDWTAVGPRFWVIGAAFVAIYLALNLLTEWHEFDRLGITLWSPDDGLSLALLLENVAFAPFVFLAAVLVDLSIAGVDRSIGVTMAAELCLTVAYVGLAFVLKNTLKFDIRQFRLPDVVAFLLLIPAGAALSAFHILWSAVSGRRTVVGQGLCRDGPLLDRRRARDRHDHSCDDSRRHLLSSRRGAGPAIRCSPSSLRTGNWSWIRRARRGWRQTILSVQSALLAGHLGGDAGRIRGRRVCVGDDPADSCRADDVRRIQHDGFRHTPIADAGAFDHRIAARRGHDGAQGRRSAPARTKERDGPDGVQRAGWRDGHGARSRSQPAAVNSDDLPACGATIAAGERRERASHGCVSSRRRPRLSGLARFWSGFATLCRMAT